MDPSLRENRPGNDPLRILVVYGLGLAILVDVTVIRIALVLSIMEILGDWTWSMPAWIEQRLPRLVIEPDDSVLEPALTQNLLA